MMTDRQKGSICIVLSAFCFAAMGLFVKLSGNINSIEKSFFRNLVAMIIAAITLIKSGQGFSYHKKDLPLLTLRSIFGTIGLIGNFIAVDHLLLSDASILQKMSPFFVLLFSYLILKERLRWQQMVFMLLAFAGSLFVIKPSFANSDLFYSVIAVVGAAGAGMAYTLVRLLSEHGVAKAKIIFFFSAFSCLAVVPYMIYHFDPLNSYQLFMLLLAGIAAAGGQFAVTSAYSYAPAKEISVLDYSQIIFSALFGLCFFKQMPDFYSLIGYFIILGAAFLNYRYQLKTA